MCCPAECLKDLQRFLHRDDPVQRPAFFALGSFNLAKTDLVPLIVHYPDDADVVYNACAAPPAQRSYRWTTWQCI